MFYRPQYVGITSPKDQEELSTIKLRLGSVYKGGNTNDVIHSVLWAVLPI